MNRFKKHIAVLILFACSLFVIPKELVHELSCHEDSVDISHFNATGTSVETIHHHCDILQLFISPFSRANFTAELCKAEIVTELLTFIPVTFSHDIFHSFEIRGPPDLV